MFAARGTGLARHAICACNQAVLAEVNSIPNGLYLLVRAKLQVDNRQAFLLLTASVRVTLTFYILVRSTFANSAFSQCFSDLVRTTAEETSIQYYDEMADTMTCQQLVSLPCTCLLPDSKHGAQGEASQTVPLSITLLQAVLERLSAALHTRGKTEACPKDVPLPKSIQEPQQCLPELGQEAQSSLCGEKRTIQLRSALLISKLVGLLLGAKQASLALREFLLALGEISLVIVDFIFHPEGPQQDAKTAADSENAHLCQALVQLLTPIFGQLLARDDDACMGSCQMLDALLRSSAAVRQAAACEMLKMGKCCP